MSSKSRRSIAVGTTAGNTTAVCESNDHEYVLSVLREDLRYRRDLIVSNFSSDGQKLIDGYERTSFRILLREDKRNWFLRYIYFHVDRMLCAQNYHVLKEKLIEQTYDFDQNEFRLCLMKYLLSCDKFKCVRDRYHFDRCCNRFDRLLRVLDQQNTIPEEEANTSVPEKYKNSLVPLEFE